MIPRPSPFPSGCIRRGLPLLAGGSILIQGAAAHRLDEYLQAARIATAADHVEVELDLTPGVAVSAALLARIDLDRDGQVSALEAEAYADQVQHALTLAVDGRPCALMLRHQEFPSVDDLKAGTGMIRLQLSSTFKPLAAGRHQLKFQNQHWTNLSVYLVNALVPAAATVAVTGQKRDRLQREFTLDFTLTDSDPGRGRGGGP